MDALKECPECGKTIVSKFKRCTCGWREKEVQKMICADHDCQYQNNGQRCKLPGSMSTSTHGGGNWYCSYHYHSLGDPKQGGEMLNYIENNYHTIMNDRVDWRRKLFEDDFKITKINKKKETKR